MHFSFSALFRPLILLGLSVALNTIPAPAASLFITGQSGNGLPANFVDSKGLATSFDVLEDSGSGTSTAGNYTLTADTAARAAIANLGASASTTVVNDIALGAGLNMAYAAAEFDDGINFSPSVLPSAAYLQMDYEISGSGSHTNISNRSAVAYTRVGYAQAYFVLQCGSDLQGSETCQNYFGLNSITSSSPVYQPATPSISGRLYIPWAMLNLTGNSFRINSYIQVAAQVGTSGLLPPAASATMNYLSSSKLGNLAILDANFQPLEANFTSESGYDYTTAIASSSVPEPATFAALFSGLAVITLLKRNTRAKH